jgi:hypothetical protein
LGRKSASVLFAKKPYPVFNPVVKSLSLGSLFPEDGDRAEDTGDTRRKDTLLLEIGSRKRKYTNFLKKQ